MDAISTFTERTEQHLSLLRVNHINALTTDCMATLQDFGFIVSLLAVGIVAYFTAKVVDDAIKLGGCICALGTLDVFHFNVKL